MRRIPGTLREYTKAVAHLGKVIYRTSYGWQIPMRDSENWLATKPSLKAAKQFLDDLQNESRVAA